MAPPGLVLRPDRLFDALHLLLVALTVPHGVLLRLSQRRLEGFHSLGSGSQTLLQLRQLAAQLRIVTHQLDRKGGGEEEFQDKFRIRTPSLLDGAQFPSGQQPSSWRSASLKIS